MSLQISYLVLFLTYCAKMPLANHIAVFLKVQYLKKEARNQVDFLHDADKINIKVSYKVILLFLVSVVRYAQSNQNNKFVLS